MRARPRSAPTQQDRAARARARRARLGGLLLAGALAMPLAGRAAPGAPPQASPSHTEAAAPGTTGKAPAQGELAKQVEHMEDIRDIRPPLPYGWDPRWRIAGGALALTAALVGLLYFLRRRRRRGPRAAVEPPPPPPHEVAWAGLTALQGRLGDPDKTFYFELSTLLRTYLDGRYGLDALEKTTDELLPAVRGLPEPAELRASLAELFRFSDPVKYADLAAGEERKRADLETATRFVRATSRPPEGADV